MTTTPDDRRQRRSHDPLVALHYQLAQARAEGRFDAMVVADDAGLVVAGAGAWAVCEELAAYAPLLARGQWVEPGAAERTRIAALRPYVDVQAVDVEGQTMLLCLLYARAGARRDAVVSRTAQGVARILAAAA